MPCLLGHSKERYSALITSALPEVEISPTTFRLINPMAGCG